MLATRRRRSYYTYVHLRRGLATRTRRRSCDMNVHIRPRLATHRRRSVGIPPPIELVRLQMSWDSSERQPAKPVEIPPPIELVKLQMSRDPSEGQPA